MKKTKIVTQYIRLGKSHFAIRSRIGEMEEWEAFRLVRGYWKYLGQGALEDHMYYLIVQELRLRDMKTKGPIITVPPLSERTSK